MPGINFYDKKEVEWADFSVAVSGASVNSKLRGLTVDVEIDLEHLYAGGNKPISIQAGNEKSSGMLKVLKGALDDLWAAAIAAGASNPLYLEVDITGSFKPNGSRPLLTILIAGVRISKLSYSMMQGDKSMECELPYLALDVKVA